MKRQITKWVAGTYNKLDIVIHNEKTYQVPANIPTTTTEPGLGSWVEVNYGKQYNTNINYNRGDLVIYNDVVYITKALTTKGVVPGTNNSFDELNVNANSTTKFITRTTATQNVAPNEFTDPTDGASAVVFLSDGIQEYWTFDGTTWIRETFKASVDSKVNKSDIVDNVTSTDTDKPLSANQGKVLKDLIDNLGADDHIVSANFDNTTNTLTLTEKDGGTQAIVIPDDKVLLVDDLLTDDATKALTAKQGKILKDLLDTNTAISADADNGITRKADGLYSFKEEPSAEAGNILTREIDNKFYVPMLDEDDMVSDSDTKPASQQSVKAYVDETIHNRLFIKKADFTAVDYNKPTEAEVKVFADNQVPKPYKDGILFYTNSDNVDDDKIFTYHIDKSGTVTTLGSATDVLTEIQVQNKTETKAGLITPELLHKYFNDVVIYLDEVTANGKSIEGNQAVLLKTEKKLYINHTNSAVNFATTATEFTQVSADLEYHYIIATQEFTGAVTPTGVAEGDYVYAIDSAELLISNGDDSFKTFDKTKLQNWATIKVINENKLYKFKKADGSFEEVKVEDGLRAKPVADATALTALTAREFELRQTKDNKNEYIFKLTADLTPAEDAEVLNLADDAATGKWILQGTGKLVDFNYQLGNIIHAIPDESNSLYEINGQTITDAKLAAYITAKPITGFTVAGDDVTTPDWRGRYLGATGAKGISATAGTIMSSVNKSHRHDIRTDYTDSGSSSQSGTIIGQANSNTKNTHRGTSHTMYEGSSYGRPETAAMPICIVGGRQLKVLIENTIIDNTVAQDDLVKYDKANNKFIPAVAPGLINDQEFVMDQSQDDGFSTYTFNSKPRHLTFQFKLYDNITDKTYSNISVPFSLIKSNGNAYYAVASMNGVDTETEYGIETAKIQLYVKYTDDLNIDVRVYKAGFEKNDSWNKRSYNMVKIVAEL